MEDQKQILTTKQAAEMLNRRPQTLRIWSCRDNGPLKPVKINGRLGWRVSDIQKLIDGE